jgi:Type II secretion system (T2SS), protein N
MPTSLSPRRAAKSAAPAAAPATSRSFWPFILLIFAAAAIAVAVSALPASIITHFLPPTVHAEDFSGSVWHGSAGRITVNARDAGAIEWQLHPRALLQLRVAADLHWVKGGFVIDGSADVDRHGITATNLQGGGPIEDLRDLGLGQGWRGTAKIQIQELKAALAASSTSVQAAVGEISLSDLILPQVAAGADLGGYSLKFADPAIAPGNDATAQLSDTGGPLSVDAAIRFSGAERSGVLSGTVKERADAPPALRSQLDTLARMHMRDAQGRIPVDLEFTL